MKKIKKYSNDVRNINSGSCRWAYNTLINDKPKKEKEILNFDLIKIHSQEQKKERELARAARKLKEERLKNRIGK